MSGLVSFVTSHYQLLIVVVLVLIILTSIGTMYFTIKYAVSVALDRFVEENDFLLELDRKTVKKMMLEQRETVDRVKKTHAIASRLYKEVHQ